MSLDLESSVVVWSDAHKSILEALATLWPLEELQLLYFMYPGVFDNVPTLVVRTPSKYLLLDAIYSIC